MTEYSAGPWKVVAGRPGWLYIVSEDLQNGVNRHIAEVPASPTAQADARKMAMAPQLVAALDHLILMTMTFSDVSIGPSPLYGAMKAAQDAINATRAPVEFVK